MTICQIYYNGTEVVKVYTKHKPQNKDYMNTLTTTFFDDLFNDVFQYPKTSYKPKFPTELHLVEDKTLYIQVPGCSDKDVSVELGEENIIVKAEANVEGFDFKLNKSYIIPKNLDRDKVTASVKDGLLTIELKKKTEKIKVKKLL